MKQPRLTPIDKRLERSAFDRLHAVPAYWRVFCQEAVARQITFSQLVSRAIWAMVWILILTLYPTLLVPLTEKAQGPEGLLAAQSILSMLTTFYLASVISSTLQASRNVSVFSHLPITDRNIAWQSYQQQLQPLIGVAYAHFWVYHHETFMKPAWALDLFSCVLMTAAQVLLYWATALLVVRYAPRRILNAGTGRYVLGLMFAFCWPELPMPQAAIDASFILLPAGWINACVVWGNSAYLLIIPYCLWCTWGIWSIEGILTRYRIRQFSIRRGEETAVDLVGSKPDDLVFSPESVAAEASRTLELSPAMARREQRDQVRSRQFLEQDDWSQMGWIEWLVFHCVSARSQIIIETLTSGHISWSSTWWTFMWASTISALVCTSLKLGPVIWMIQIGLSFVYVLTGFWPAFHLRSLGGMYGSQLYNFPLGLDETFSTLVKVALIRILAATVVWFPVITLILLHQGRRFEDCLPIAITMLVIALATAIWAFFFLFGLGAEFSDGMSKLGWFICMTAFALTYLFGIYYAISSAEIPEFARRVKEMGVGMSIVMTATTLNWLLFRTVYRRGAVDLVVFQTPHSEQHFAARELAEIRSAHKVEQRRARKLRTTPGT